MLAGFDRLDAFFQLSQMVGKLACRAFTDNQNARDIAALLPDQILQAFKSLVMVSELHLNRFQDFKNRVFNILGHGKNITATWLFGKPTYLTRSTSTPGSGLPSIHSRNAPPAVDT